MYRPPLPPGESERLARLRELVVLDTPPEAVFDSIARMASDICGVPIALLSLVDAERQWFKANVGLPGVNETPRDVAFCAHAIHDDGLFEVPDATDDVRFADNPLVQGAPDIRFYAGAPLVLPGGARIGTLCVIDRQSRRLSAEQAQQLAALARIAVQALVMRRDLIDRALSVRSEHEQRLAESEARHRAILDAQSELVSQASPDGTLLYVNPAYAAHFGRTVASILGTSLFDYVDPADHAAVRSRIDHVLASGETNAGENRMASASADDVWIAWTNTRQLDGQGRALLHSVGHDISGRKRAEQALRASRAFLERTGRVAGIGGWEVELPTGLVTWSEETHRIHEVDADYQPTLETALAFYPPEAREQITLAVQQAIAGGPPWDLELRFVTGRGRPIWVRSVGGVEFDGGVPARLIGAFQDITERVRIQHELQRRGVVLATVTEAVPDIVSVVDRDARYRFVNGAFERWYGVARRDVLGRRIDEVLAPEEVQRNRHWADRALAGETVDSERGYPEREGMPQLAVSHVPIRLADGSIDGWVEIAQDITRHRTEQSRLRRLAQQDTLTDLLNRAGFEAELAARARDGGASLALLMIDLDRFKPVNDRHGHPVGDQLLKRVAQRMQAMVRPDDGVARIGGDEFAVLLSGVREAGNANAVAEKIVQALGAPFEIGDLQLVIGASAGVAHGVRSDGVDGLIARADAMLYRAKQAGRGRSAGAD